MTASSGKHLEDTSHAHIVSLKCKLKTSARGSDGLSFDLDRDRGSRQLEVTTNKIQKRKYQAPRFMLQGIFGFAEHQHKATCGLGNKLTLTRRVKFLFWKKQTQPTMVK